MSHVPLDDQYTPNGAGKERASPDAHQSQQLGNYERPFDVYDPEEQRLFIESVNSLLLGRRPSLDDQEQRTIRLGVDGDFEYVQAVVERLRQVLNVTWVSAEPERCHGRSVNWFVVVEWPELIPETDASKGLTRTQWQALERLYRQRDSRHAEWTTAPAHRATLESLIARQPPFARECLDSSHSTRIDITEAGISYYEIHKETYLQRYWAGNALLPRTEAP